MSLISWYPFTDNYFDHVINDTMPTGSVISGTRTAGGPLGGYCSSVRGTAYNSRLRFFDYTKEFTMSFWTKNSFEVILGAKQTGSTYLNRVMTLHFDSQYCQFFWNYSDLHIEYQHNLTADDWHHVTICFSKDQGAKLYIDGNLSYSQPNVNIHEKRLIEGIEANGSSACDLRIYSHCLSQTEIKKLNQCLMIHLTFDEQLNESIPTRASNTNLLPLELQEKYVRVEPSVYGNPVAYSITTGLKQGSPYTLSSYITVYPENQATNMRMTLVLEYSDGTTSINQIFMEPADGIERFYSVTLQADPNKTLNRLYGWILDHSTGNGQVQSYRSAALVASDKPYVEMSRTGDYHEAKMDYWTPSRKNIRLSSDAIDGGKSYKGSSTSYLEYYNVFTVKDCFPNQATASMWIKADITQNWVVFADFLTELGFGMYNGVGIIAAASSANKRTVTNMSTLWKTGQWNHVAVSIGSGTNRCWINGVEGTYGNANYWTHTKDFYIGCRTNGNERGMFFTGLLDDFRFYNRCLEEAEILELYKTPVKFGAPGYVCANTFTEGQGGNKIKKNPVIECSEIQEDIDLDYERLEYIESTGSQYINTGVKTFGGSAGDTIPIALWAHYEMTNYSPGQILCGAYNGTTTHYFNYKEASNTTIRTHWFYTDFTTDILWSNGLEVKSQLNIPLGSGDQLEFSTNGKRLIGKPTTKGGTRTDMYLTAYNAQGAARYFFYCKLYGFRIWVTSTEHPETMPQGLYRNFVPCRRKSDGAVGLLDTVENKFYASEGTEQYIAGPTIATGSIRLFKDGKIAARSIIEI